MHLVSLFTYDMVETSFTWGMRCGGVCIDIEIYTPSDSRPFHADPQLRDNPYCPGNLTHWASFYLGNITLYWEVVKRPAGGPLVAWEGPRDPSKHKPILLASLAGGDE